MGITSRLAAFVSRTSFDDLPSEVVARSKDMMINAAAAGLAGAAQPESQAVARFVQEMGGNGRCTVIGMGMRTSPVYASLANGLMIHLLDFDDEIMGRGNHPTSAIFPVVMSLGEMNGYSGKQVVTAFALGCELSSKLGAIGDLDYPEPVESARPGWHTDGVAGAIGATAAAAKLLELDQEKLENAFGIASGEAAGIQANLLTPSRAFQCGRAAMNGVMAALLAQRGFTGARDAIEAPGGLLGCYLSGGEVDEEDFFSRLGSPYDVVHPGVVLKLFPCESAGHTSIEAVLQLIQQYRVEPDQVEAVRVRVTPAMLRLLPFSEPQSGWQARFSLSYVVTVALLQGQPLLDHFTDAAVQDQRLREMLARVTVEATETATESIPHPSTLLVKLSDGRELQQRVEFARGQPELPLSDEELDAKFLYCTRYILPPDHIEGAIDQFRDLENVQNVTGLASILGG